jgi:uncharacterized protein (DUF1697 family)
MLRAVNVGGRKLKMEDLRALFVGLGHSEVRTYVQSGNVVFTSSVRSPARLARAVEDRIERDLDLDVTVLVRTGRELADVVRSNPFVKAVTDLATLHVTFLSGTPPAARLSDIEPAAWAPDEFRVAGREVYLHCPGGYGRTKLNNAFWERRLDLAGTTRKWRTVTTLCEMAGG